MPSFPSVACRDGSGSDWCRVAIFDQSSQLGLIHVGLMQLTTDFHHRMSLSLETKDGQDLEAMDLPEKRYPAATTRESDQQPHLHVPAQGASGRRFDSTVGPFCLVSCN